MAFMEYLNQYGEIFIALAGIAALILVFFTTRNEKNKISKPEQWVERYQYYIAGALILIGVLLRFYRLGSLPAGLNQDEASMGYDAFALANYGVDRNGYHFPVYPVAWGAGHGPLYVYFSSIFIKLFGLSVFSYRFGMALLGGGTLVLFFFLLKRLSSAKAALTGLFLLAISPWHILLSRWGLDSNPVPFFVLLAVFLYVLAIEKQKARYFAFAGAAFSLSLYCYANTYFAVPIMLLIAGIYAIIHKKINLKCALSALGAMIIVALPLGIFWVINVFDLPEIATRFISFPKMTALRSQSALIAFDSHFWENLVHNCREYLPYLYRQKESYLYNAVPQFGTLYLFASPLLIFGLIEIIMRYFKQRGKYQRDIIMVAWLAGAMVVTLLYTILNVNRLSILFIPMIYLCLRGIILIYHSIKPAAGVILLIFVLGFSQFCVYYFGGTYEQQFGNYFYDSFEEAVEFSQGIPADKVYVTNEVSGSYLELLFFLKEDPHVFHDSVEYINDKVEFRKAISYGKYQFGIPSKKQDNAVYIVDNASELPEFRNGQFQIKQFRYYSVVWK